MEASEEDQKLVKLSPIFRLKQTFCGLLDKAKDGPHSRALGGVLVADHSGIYALQLDR